MSPAQAFFEYVNELPLSAQIRESLYLFPALDVLHVLSVILLAGTIAVVDLRLLGAAFRDIPVQRLSAQVLPFTWLGALGAFASGVLLFLPQAAQIWTSPMLQAKLALLALAGINVAAWHSALARHRDEWSRHGTPPWQARVAATASLALWTGIIASGRLIAFVF